LAECFKDLQDSKRLSELEYYAIKIQNQIQTVMKFSQRTQRLSTEYYDSVKQTIAGKEIQNEKVSKKRSIFEAHNITDKVTKYNFNNIKEEISGINDFTRQTLKLYQKKEDTVRKSLELLN